MELDDLKNAWNDCNNELDNSIRLNTGLLRESALNKTSTSLRRLSRLIFVELLINFGAILLLGMFLADHTADMRFFVPALTLHVSAILLTASCIYQLVSLQTIDYASPILSIQKRLERLRIHRIQVTKWVLLLAPLAWVPLMIVSVKGLLGLNAYVFFTTEWLAASLLFGVIVIPMMLWVCKRFAQRMEGSPFLRRLMNDIAGNNLIAAAGFLNELSKFEEQD